MNKVILIGRLTRDPEIRYTGAENMAVCRFTLAVDRKGKKEDGQQTADFIPCVAFSHNAEFIGKYFNKGAKIVTEGHIQTGSYTDRDGKKVYTTDVIIESAEFAESNGDNKQAPEPETANNNNGFIDISDAIEDELPFN